MIKDNRTWFLADENMEEIESANNFLVYFVHLSFFSLSRIFVWKVQSTHCQLTNAYTVETSTMSGLSPINILI